MARRSSKGSARGKKSTSKSETETAETISAETGAEETLTPEPEAGELGGDTVLVGDGAMGEDSVAAEADPDSLVTLEPGDTTAVEPSGDDPVQTEIVESDPAPEPTPEPVAAAPAPVVEQRGPGFGALLLGGVVAAALGFAAAFFGFLNPGSGDEGPDPALTAALETIEAQAASITALEAQVAELAAVEPPVIPEVDLSGVETAIAGVAEDVSATTGVIDGLTTRIVALEERPVFTGEVDEDNAAMAAAVEALEARLSEERDAAAEAVAAAQAAQEAAAAEMQAASAAAQAAIAEAEARAQETAAATQAQSALSGIRIAMENGDPFAGLLADLPVDAPDALAAVAEAGVPTIDDLRAGFPALAREALALSIRENADDSTAGRVGAFLTSQFAGRSVEPREGDDPDAVLSRAEDAVARGDLPTALTEIAALPEGAQAVLTDWATQVQSRADADAALSELAAMLDN